MPVQTVRVEGLRELQRALRNYDKELGKELRKELKAAAEIVADQARSLFSGINPASAAGFKPRARGASAFVEQSKRRTTGQHPSFGALQMRMALLPVLVSKEPYVINHLEGMLDRLGNQEGF